MPTLLVISLHPSEVISMESFKNFFDVLLIEAYELSFAKPESEEEEMVFDVSSFMQAPQLSLTLR